MNRLLILLFLSFGFFACTKQKEAFCVNATVEWMGNPAADGLGWVLKKDTDSVPQFQIYIPVNLSDAYKKQGMNVEACLYQTNEKATCFCASPPNMYFITSIRSR